MKPEALLAMTRFSRRNLLKGVGVGAVGFTVAQASFLRATAATSERLQDILNATATVERFGVTFLGAGLQSATARNFNNPWPPIVVAIVTAARAQERYHLDAFERAGGKALVDTFTVPPKLLTDYDAFFSAVVEEETLETAAQIAAMTAFTELKRPDLVKVSFQYAAEEAEHRVLANYTRGIRPANDRAFADAPFTTAAEIVDSLKRRGLIGGSGTPIAYPGPGEIDASNVTNKEPGRVAVNCAPGATSATPGAGASPAA